MITNKYKIYRNKRKNANLQELCNSAASIWNHTVLLSRRYYSLYDKSVPKKRMRQQISKLRKSNPYWKQLNSQPVQEVVDRVYESYDRFFKRTQKRPPKPKKWSDFRSFVFTQSGWSIEGNKFRINKVTTVKFSKSRDYYDVKNIRVKRDSVGDWWLIILSSRGMEELPNRKSHKGASVGFDFSLKEFMVSSDCTVITPPRFYYDSQTELKRLNRNLSLKKKGSKNRTKAKKELALLHRKISDKRRDYYWKLANDLCTEYSFISLETLDIESMKSVWGKKVSDLGFAQFVPILHHVAGKKGTTVHHIDKWYPSSKTCGDCESVNKELKLSDRSWVCTSCGVEHDRDENAAKNILRQGIVEYQSQSNPLLSGVSDVDGKESLGL